MLGGRWWIGGFGGMSGGRLGWTGSLRVSPSLILVAHPVPLRGAIPDFAILQNRGQQAASGNTRKEPSGNFAIYAK